MSLNRNIVEKEIKMSAEQAKLDELEEKAYAQRECVISGERHLTQLATLQDSIMTTLNWGLIATKEEVTNLEIAQGMLIEDGIRIFKAKEAKEAVLTQEIHRLKGELAKAKGAMEFALETLSPEKSEAYLVEIRDLEMQLNETVSWIQI